MSIKQIGKSLKRRGNALSDTFYQLEVINNRDMALPTFEQVWENAQLLPLQASETRILQLNIGKMCNQTCAHCHVDAGPDRTEMMTREDMEYCLAVLRDANIETVDITGGAPEMHPLFRWLVQEITALGRKTIVRCNLTIIRSNPKYHDLPQFFAENRVEVVSSMPYFSKRRTDAQRGDGVFEDSIAALQMLNAVGYGKPDSGLLLQLVYNPAGSFMPGDQNELQTQFKLELHQQFGIVFNNLYAITNMPISRFLDYLLQNGLYEQYMQKLIAAFNPQAAQGLMCKDTLSVSWDGFLYDCDFNQMLDLKIAHPQTHVRELKVQALNQRKIVVGRHCFGCMAGNGSSCGGTTA